MRIIDIIKIALTNFKFNKLRTLLTIGGIAVGIGSIVFLVSLGYGLQQLTIKKIAGIEAINTLNVSLGKTTMLKLDEAAVTKLKEIPQVEKISPVLNLPGKVTFKDIKDIKIDCTLNGIDDSFFGLEGLKPYAGDFFKDSPDQTVVSTALVKTLNIQSAQLIGQEVTFDIFTADPANPAKQKQEIKKYTAVGVIEDESSAFAYLPLLSIKDVGLSNYNMVKVKVKDRQDLQTVQKQIEDMGFAVTSIAETISQVDQTFRIIQMILALLGIIALLVASIGMFNTMTIALLERIHDIGIMKAIGTTDSDVYKIFLAEAASIGFVGGVLGVIIGWLTSKGINFLVNLLAKSVGGEPSTLFYIPALFAAGVIIFAFIVGVATGFYPARRAAKINPLEALRYE